MKLPHRRQFLHLAAGASKRPGRARAFVVLKRSEIHAAHAAAGPAWHSRALLLRHLGDHRLGGDEQARH
jgi:hypothetical protein